MRLRILRPDKIIIEGESARVVVPGAKGEFGVLPGHAQMINALGTGICTFDGADCRNERILVSGGVCHIFEDDISVLSETIESISEINTARSKDNLNRIEEKLASAEISDAERDFLELEKRREQTRIELAQ